MKYWIGYLTAAIIGAITWALMQMAGKYTALVDMVYPYVTRTLQDVLAEWSSELDFCLWQLIAVAIGAVLLVTIVLMIVLRYNPLRWLGWVLTAGSVLYLLHMLVFGLNYYAGPLADDIRMEVREYTVEELADATAYYRDRANLLADRVNRDEKGDAAFQSFETLALQAADGFDTLVYEHSYPVFAGCTLPVKKLGWADLYTSMGITGFTMGLTGEAAVNPQIPDVTLPFTMCHEMAHRMSIASEGDANFAAFLAAHVNESIEYQYSAYFMAYRYCYHALLSANTAESSAAAARISSQASPELQHDMESYSDFFSSKRSDSATHLADTANDTYLKASGETSGIASYGEVCDLLVNWHYQQIVLPTLTADTKPFDPLDENQVDLSGIVNAKEPKPTEAPEQTGGVG